MSLLQQGNQRSLRRLNETTSTRRPAQILRLNERNTGSEPGLGDFEASRQYFPDSQPQIIRISATDCFDAFKSLGEPGMRAGECVGNGFVCRDGFRPFGEYSAGVSVTSSDTIGSDSRVPFIPFREERRQIEQAAHRSTKIPCFRRPQSTIYFLFWFQPVAAVNEERLRQLKSVHLRPEKVEGKVAHDCQDLFRLQVFPMGIPQTQDAASMANSEVSKCR